MKLLVTAFGPFDGRTENASSLALAELASRILGLETLLLAVDMLAAPASLIETLRQVQPDALIMLGESPGSTRIKLETTAWNELDFRIPDIAGNQPRAQRISTHGPAFRKATLPLKSIYRSLESQDVSITLSHNPGRYLCNQVFYVALEYLETRELSCPAGFIHLPLASELPTHLAADALRRVIGILDGPSSI
jgi:pyroglutamyl-peptidase